MMPTRTYKPWEEKHKPPRGFGSWCPTMPEGRAQALLDQAIPDPDPESGSAKLYAVSGDWCFVAQVTRSETNEYHGYPVPGAEMPERVLRALHELGRLSPRDRSRLRRQRNLPERYE